MANRFSGNFIPPRKNGPFSNMMDAMNQFNDGKAFFVKGERF